MPSTELIMNEELPKALFKIRRKILYRVYDYLRITYYEDYSNPAIREALQIIADRWKYKNHHTLGITDGL